MPQALAFHPPRPVARLSEADRLRAENARLREELDTAREEIRQLRDTKRFYVPERFPAAWRLSERQARLLRTLMAIAPFARTKWELCELLQIEDSSDPSRLLGVHIFHLRRKLRSAGFDLQSECWRGYWLTRETAAAIRAACDAERAPITRAESGVTLASGRGQ